MLLSLPNVLFEDYILPMVGYGARLDRCSHQCCHVGQVCEQEKKFYLEETFWRERVFQLLETADVEEWEIADARDMHTNACALLNAYRTMFCLWVQECRRDTTSLLTILRRT